MREYNKDLHIRLTPADMAKLKQRMKEAGVQNMSAYVRKMAIDGYIVNLDLTDVKEVVRLMRYSSNNLNQYAKKANETGSIYKHDIDDLNDKHERLWNAVCYIMDRLSSIM